MTTTKPPPRRWVFRTVVALAVIVALAAADIGAYYALLSGRTLGKPYVAERGRTAIDAMPVYHTPWIAGVVAPAHHLDRLLRREHWRVREMDRAEIAIPLGDTHTLPSGWTYTTVRCDTHTIVIETDGHRVTRLAVSAAQP